jgi:uracil-DNA glycosylase
MSNHEYNYEIAAAILEWLTAIGMESVVDNSSHEYFSALPSLETSIHQTISQHISLTSQQHANSETEMLASQAHTVDDLLQSMQEMDFCPLKRTAMNAVKGWGNPHAPLLIIGDFPTVEEDMAGQYCHGDAGDLLSNILRSVGLSKHACYALPLIWWRPPAGRQASADEVASCSPFVKRLINLQRPKHIVITGGLTAKILLHTQGSIAQLRNKSWSYETEGQLPLPVTISYSPHQLLQYPQLKAHAWQDWLKLSFN